MTKPILGIDAGFQAMGVVAAVGRQIIYARTFRTEKRAAKLGVRVADDDTDRCQQLARALWETIGALEPAGAVVEMPSGGAQGARANRAMGMSTAVVASVLELARVPIEVVTPMAVKKASAGKKDASKDEVEAAVRKLFTWDCSVPGTKAEREHIMDAAGALLAAEHGTLMRTVDRLGA